MARELEGIQSKVNLVGIVNLILGAENSFCRFV